MDRIWNRMLFTGLAAMMMLTACQKQQTSPGNTEQPSAGQDEVSVGVEETVITGEAGVVTVTGSGADVKDGVVTITKAGTYRLSGQIDDGQIIVDAGKEDEIRLVLDGVSITSSSSSAIYGAQSGLITVALEKDTENTVTDASSYVYENQADDEPNAAIFSKDDLKLEGEGSLTVNGKYQEGIRGKDDLVIDSGTYFITAVNDGVKGKDSVEIYGGNFTIQAGGDGIQSSNDTDESKGYVKILDGNFEITAGKKGIQAETMVEIQGGDFQVVSEDDSLHSNGDVKVTGGNLSLSSGDDAIHGDNQVTVDDGEITVMKSYEGIEGLSIDINGGVISIVSEDDGLNAAGGNDASGNISKWGDNPFAATEGAYIKITGGQLFVDAGGDGLDSNGDFYMEGGHVTVEGPKDNGNGTLDYNGKGIITGGSFIGTGSFGMSQSFSQDSSQPVLVVFYSETQPANTEIKLLDGEGKLLAAQTPSKEFSSLIVSLPDLLIGQSCQVSTGDDVMELTVDNMITQYGTGNGMGRGQERGQGRGAQPIGEAGEFPQRPEGITGTEGMEGTEGMRGAGGMRGAEGMEGAGEMRGAEGMEGTGGMRGAEGMEGTGGNTGAAEQLPSSPTGM